MATRKKEKGRSNVIEGRTEARHKNRLRFYLINIFLGLIIFIVGSVILILLLFPFKDIRVEGNTYYDDAVYTPYVVTDEYSFNTIYIKIKTLFEKIENPEFVEDIKISIENRTTILVSVTEKTWSGYCIDTAGQYVYFDEEGNVVEVSERLIEGKPEILGLVVEGAEEGQPLPVENTIRRNIVQIQEYLAVEQIGYDSVYFNADGTITVFINGGNIQVSLGTSNLMREKTRRLPYILPQIQEMTGILHLEDWSEDSTDIVFEKR